MLTSEHLINLVKQANELQPQPAKPPLRQAVDAASNVGTAVVGAAAGVHKALKGMDKAAPIYTLPQ